MLRIPSAPTSPQHPTSIQPSPTPDRNPSCPSYPTQHKPVEVGGPRWERNENPTECNPPHHRPRQSVPSAPLLRPIISSRLSPRPDRSIHRTVIPLANPTSERLETASHLPTPRSHRTPAASAQCTCENSKAFAPPRHLCLQTSPSPTARISYQPLRNWVWRENNVDVEIKAVNWMSWVGVGWKGKSRWRVGCYLPLAEVHGVSLALGGLSYPQPRPPPTVLEVVDSRAYLDGRR